MGKQQLDTGWRKASYSGTNGNCVEVGADRAVLVRDSVDPDGGTLGFTIEAWRVFIGRLK